ncbi:NAD-dependent epimerase/dehydratase family protein [Legionella geestiana]|nr:NAD-dependent epimerase/dehydratase family protein [Legionella geestiana]
MKKRFYSISITSPLRQSPPCRHRMMSVSLTMKRRAFCQTLAECLYSQVSHQRLIQTAGSHKMMKHALVTGGCGFIGTHLVHALRAMDVNVTVLDKQPPQTSQPLEGCTFVEADLLSRETVRECLQNVDTCFHLAAILNVVQCKRDWLFSHQNNVDGFNAVLNAIKSTGRPIKTVYASSCAVYGEITPLPLTEAMMPAPISPYGADKLVNEIYAGMLAKCFGIPSIGLRFFNVYGPLQRDSSPYSGVIAAFRKNLLQGKPLTIYGDGEQLRDFVHVSDVVCALIKAANTPPALSGVFNVSTGKTTSINQLAQYMMRRFNREVPVVYEPPRAEDIRLSCGCPKKAQEILRFTPAIDIEQGLYTLDEHG